MVPLIVKTSYLSVLSSYHAFSLHVGKSVV